MVVKGNKVFRCVSFHLFIILLNNKINWWRIDLISNYVRVYVFLILFYFNATENSTSSGGKHSLLLQAINDIVPFITGLSFTSLTFC